MDFVYTPEGREDEPHRWTWEPLKISSVDAEIIEARTGMLFPQWVVACENGSIRAQHAYLFVQLSKKNAGLEWGQVVFTPDQVKFEYTDEDEQEWLRNLEAAEESGRELSKGDLAMLETLREKHRPSGADAGGDDAPDPTKPPGRSGKKAKSRSGSS